MAAKKREDRDVHFATCQRLERATKGKSNRLANFQISQKPWGNGRTLYEKKCKTVEKKKKKKRGDRTLPPTPLCIKGGGPFRPLVQTQQREIKSTHSPVPGKDTSKKKRGKGKWGGGVGCGPKNS